MTEHQELYFTAREMQARLRISRSALHRLLTSSNKPPHLRLGRLLRFPVEQVLEWEANWTVGMQQEMPTVGTP